jgi:murein DD-endopeptidase MepM/ murein hydrolase activator NlpD
MAITLRLPSNNPVGDKFGPRPQHGTHHGWDFAFSSGGVPDLAIVAAADGVVVQVVRTVTMGRYTKIDHGEIQTAYAHQAEQSVTLHQNVVAGQRIGTIGEDGTLAAGKHLHFEVWSGGVRVDPAPFFSAGGGFAALGHGVIWAFNPPVAAVQKRVQAALTARGLYHGPVDGAWGINSIKGIQLTIRTVGYTGPVDGTPGPNTSRLVQVYAARFGDYHGPIDSILGPNGWAGFALGLERS